MNTTRRQFLKGSAALAGAALTAQAIGSRAYAGGNDLIRIGLIGCGGRASGAAAQALSVPNSNVKLVAICDAFENKVKGALDNLKKKHAEKIDVKPENMFWGLESYKKVIEQCDLVVTATPPGFRPQHFEAAVAAGKHVFMEKPCCVDAAGARKVIEAAKQADAKKLKVVVGLQRHYQGVYLATLAKYQSGEFGKIVSGNIYWNGGPIWYRKRQKDQNEMQFQVNNWYHFNWLCGDHITEQHVHNIDVANWFIGATPVKAKGTGGRDTMPDGPTEIFDHHEVTFTYPNGVVIASECRQIAGTKGNVSEHFVTDKGFKLDIGRITDSTGKEVWKYDGKDADPYQVEHNELHKFIREDIAHNDAYYGASSSFSSVLGRTATYSGLEYTYDDLIKKDWSTFPKEGPTWETAAPVQPQADGSYKIPKPGEYKI